MYKFLSPREDAFPVDLHVEQDKCFFAKYVIADPSANMLWLCGVLNGQY